MPVDHSKASSSGTSTRTRVTRKINEEELKDIELKRLRGEISCAECRRQVSYQRQSNTTY